MKKTDSPTFASEIASAFGERYLQHAPLSIRSFNHLGGVADHLVVAESPSDLINAAKICLRYRIPYLVLGRGSGTLVSDVGFPGLVIINKSQKVYFAEHLGQAIVDSGVGNDEVVNVAAHKGLGGLEFLTHVPGTIGGAVMTRVSVGRAQLSQFLREIMVFMPDGTEGKTVNMVPEQIYQESSFFSLATKTNFPPVILAARLQFVHLAEDEVMRRLVRARKERSWQDNRLRLGRVFDQDLAAISATLPKLFKLRLRAVSFQRHNPDLLIINNKAKPMEVRNDLKLIKDLVEANGHQLAERLSFVGYWPNEEEDAPTEGTTLNTEGI